MHDKVNGDGKTNIAARIRRAAVEKIEEFRRRRLDKQQNFRNSGTLIGRESEQNIYHNVRLREIIPHDEPFLFVDRIIEVESGKRAVGVKNVTINEAYFRGHFPRRPIMPGVLIIETMGQVGGFALLEGNPQFRGKLPFLVGVDKTRFRKPVLPGDRLRIEAEILACKRNLGRVKATAYVTGEVYAEALLSFSIQDY